MTQAPHPLTPLEIASGVVVGADQHTPPLPAYDGRSPRAALESAVLPALLRPPCVVAFSGGRDSSAMLALAAYVARREELPAPVALTIRYPDAPETFEDDWQERVVGHVGVTEWQRISITDELDIVGPFAQTALRRHGVLFPLNAYTYMPMFPFATGGTIVTGLDGDGLLDTWPYAGVADMLSRRRRPQPRDVLRLGLFAGPRALQQAVYARRLMDRSTWLTPGADLISRRAEAAEITEEPTRWDRRVDWWQARRYLSLSLHFDDLLGADAGVALCHPMLDRAFLAALAHMGGRHGPGDRTTVMRMLVSDLLPDDVLTRESKAAFDEPFFNRHSREFAVRWDGSAIDPALVDADRLRASWLRPQPAVGSAIQLQATWLATEGASV